MVNGNQSSDFFPDKKGLPASFWVSVLIFLLVLLLGSRESFREQRLRDAGNLEAIARGLLPQGLSLASASEPAAPFEGRDSDGRVAWKAVLSHLADPTILGYAGPIDMMVGLTAQGQVTGVKILSHRETPSFVKGIEEPWFLDQFKGKTADDPLVPFQDIDGITHATVSIKAICDNVKSGLLFGRPAGGGLPSRGSKASTPATLNLLFLGIVFFLAILEKRLSRDLNSLLIVVLVGFASQQYLSLVHVKILLQNWKNLWVLPVSLLALWLMSLFFLLLRIRGYCLFLCPMGRLQELLWRLKGKFGGPFSESEQSVIQPFSLGRILLWASLVALAFVPGFPLEKMEVFAPLFLRPYGTFGWVLVISALVGSLVLPRFYCRVLCPLNAAFLDFERVKNVLKGAPPSEPSPETSPETKDPA